MTDGYDAQDLLNLLSSEKAEKLLVKSGKPPALWWRDEENVFEGPNVTFQNAMALFRDLATARHVQELDICGDVYFTYADPSGKTFRVIARIECGHVTL